MSMKMSSSGLLAFSLLYDFIDSFVILVRAHAEQNELSSTKLSPLTQSLFAVSLNVFLDA